MYRELTDPHIQKIKTLLTKALLPFALKPLDRVGELVEKYNQLHELLELLVSGNFEEQYKIRLLQEYIAYRRKVLALLEEWLPVKAKYEHQSVLRALDELMQPYLDSTPAYFITPQSIERFRTLEQDGASVRFIKAIKRVGFAIYSSPVHVFNVFLKLLKKDNRSVEEWKQKIPARKLTAWYFENYFLENFGELLEHSGKIASRTAFRLLEIDRKHFEAFKLYVIGQSSQDEYKLERAHLQKESEDLRIVINKEAETVRFMFGECVTASARAFEKQAELGGTLEFSKIRHREGSRKRQRKKIRRKVSQKMSLRFNTLRALADDWKFNQEIFIITAHSQKAGLQFHSRLMSRSQVISKALLHIPELIKGFKDSLQQTGQNDIRKTLQQLRLLAARKLQKEVLPDVSHLILEQNFPLIIDENEEVFLSGLSGISDQRILIPAFDPDKAYPDKALQQFSPSGIVEFEMAPAFRKTFLKTKTQTIGELEKLNSELEDIGRMVVFNLDSAIAMAEEMPGQDCELCRQDAIEGLDRAINNTLDLAENFQEFTRQLSTELNNAGARYIQDFKALTDNENIEQIRYRIARAKAIKRSEQIGIRLKTLLSRESGKMKGYYRLGRIKVDSGVNTLREKLGMAGMAKDISGEISDLLVAPDTPLPFVYRRLFVVEPLKENTFYLPRENEQKMLLTAYQKWQQGTFSPVLIFGEKGSGVSTFVQMFVKQQLQTKPVVYSVSPQKRIQNEEDFYLLLGLSIRGEAFSGSREFYEFVETAEPFVVFVDKIHLMYLRQPGGFNVLKRFFEVISSTSKKIFWICTCGRYASEYLNKSVGLYDYFPVLIRMRNLSTGEVKRVIMLRHKASGFALAFRPCSRDLHERSFVKKNAQEQQRVLEEKYFASLNRLTQSNIAFALQLWLRSTEKLEENRIYLNSLEEINFSFMHNLPAEVIFGLHALILHETLDVYQLSQVVNVSRRQAYLMLMRLADKGIVQENSGLYGIHPLLYRQAIVLLKERNLIH